MNAKRKILFQLKVFTQTSYLTLVVANIPHAQLEYKKTTLKATQNKSLRD